MHRKIGITGGSGSGKGYICEILRNMGYACIDTDAIVHDLYVKNRQCLDELQDEFGSEIFENGVLVRPKLAQIVFSDSNKLEMLNAIVHRYVIAECDSICNDLFKKGNSVVFIDAPQLYEAGMDKTLDAVIAVVAPMDVRKSRIIRRDSITEDQAQKRIDNQHTNEYFVNNADYIIENHTCSDEELKKSIEEILTTLGV